MVENISLQLMTLNLQCFCSFELGVDVMDYMDDLLGLQTAGKSLQCI